jgi:hypothetical protein
MSAHWDFVLSEVEGDWFTIIGDDDGLMPSCIQSVRDLIFITGRGMPIRHAFANYRWPDFPEACTRNTVQFHHSVGWGESVISSGEHLHKIAQGRGHYLDGPMVYHNFIPTAIVRRLLVDGVFFRRASPDMYSSLAIAASVPRFFVTEQLLTLSGQGAKANGAAVQRGAGNLFITEMEQHYRPRFRSRAVQMHLLDTLLEVVEHFGLGDLAASIRYDEHVLRALREVFAMSPSVRQEEFMLVAAFAFEHHVVLRSIITAAWRVLSSPLRANRAMTANTVRHAFGEGERITLPGSVENVFDAAANLARQIAERRPGG